MRSLTDRPIWMKANAGLPVIEAGTVVYKVDPEDFAVSAVRLVDAGATFVGGCCGTSPAFVRALVRRLTHVS